MNAKPSKLWIFGVTGIMIMLSLLLAPMLGGLFNPSAGCSLGKVGAQDNPCLQQEASLSALGFQATLLAVDSQGTISALEAQIATLQSGNSVALASPTAAPSLPAAATDVAASDNTPTPPRTLIDAVLPDGVLTAYQSLDEAGVKGGKLKNGLYYLGSATAPVTVEQFSSYSCPHCRDYHYDVIVNLFDKIAAGQMKFVFVPLTFIGEFDSTNMSRATICAGEQDRYWEMHDVMFDWLDRYGSRANEVDRLTAAAVQLGLRPELFRACMSNIDTQTVLDRDEQEAAARGLESTPSIYIDGKLALSSAGGPPSLNELRRLIEVKIATRP
ncbi:MAG: thioredoxin domain-containing protein [Anaerolineae bacterium]|nr:thioredoxin domain-containing protein [Anaerolineae bacterium]